LEMQFTMPGGKTQKEGRKRTKGGWGTEQTTKAIKCVSIHPRGVFGTKQVKPRTQ